MRELREWPNTALTTYQMRNAHVEQDVDEQVNEDGDREQSAERVEDCRKHIARVDEVDDFHGGNRAHHLDWCLHLA